MSICLVPTKESGVNVILTKHEYHTCTDIVCEYEANSIALDLRTDTIQTITGCLCCFVFHVYQRALCCCLWLRCSTLLLVPN